MKKHEDLDKKCYFKTMQRSMEKSFCPYFLLECPFSPHFHRKWVPFSQNAEKID
jgi:hypothetical protein